MRLLAYLGKQSKTFLVFIGFMLVGVVGLIDLLTGDDFGISVFYVLPILLVTWYTNQGLGLVISLVSAIVWLVADIAPFSSYSFSIIPFWNSFIRLVYFFIITFLLSSLRNSLELARTDHLTSALNSRYFYEIVQMEMYLFQRNQRPFTIAYIDLDNFKAINDQFGHAVGDQVLITLVNSVSLVIRKSDFIARLGGDEFAVLFPETDEEAARIIFSKIQNSFVEAVQQKNWSATLSVGVLTCKVPPQTTDDLIRMVDGLMYSAKNSGKNTVNYSTYNG